MKKLLAVLLALAVFLPGLSLCIHTAVLPFGAAALAEAEEAAEAGDEADVDEHTKVSEALYEANLGEYKAVYDDAKAAENISERYAKLAIAEAKLLESCVMFPLFARGGNYAVSRVAPRTVNTTLWGNDSERLGTAVVVDGESFLTNDEIDEMRAKWGELRGTGTYSDWVKEYLTGKGYALSDTYAIANSGDPKTWDVLATSRATDSEKIALTYDGLMVYDEENVKQPALAESFEVSEDGTVYTFHLRQGVTWVDSQGRKVADVKADDFVAGMQHMMDAMGGLEYLVEEDGCGIVGSRAYIDGETRDFGTVGVKAVDDYTVAYTLDKPCSFFTTMLGYSCFAPMSREYYASQGGKFGDEYDAEAADYLYGKDPDHIAYCGPYLVTSYTPENSIIFKANDSYYNKDTLNVHTVNWLYNDGADALKPYNDAKAGMLSGTGLNASPVEQAKADGLFDDYVYVSPTNAYSFLAYLNLNRSAYANFNDASTVVSAQDETQRARTSAAMKNVHFRRALAFGLDRAAYNAQMVGEDLKLFSVINSYTPGNFVVLEEDATVSINGTDTTFPAGTYYGAVMQAQIEADNFPARVWDPEQEGGIGASSGFDGWYNPEAAKAEMAIAVEELAAEGVEITAEDPIQLDYPVFTANETYDNRSEVFRQSEEASLDGLIAINRVVCDTADEWYYAGFYTDYGYEANYEIYDVTSWGPDYGDPQTYLDTFLPNYAGYMAKGVGLF